MLWIPKDAVWYEKLYSYVGSQNEEASSRSRTRRELLYIDDLIVNAMDWDSHLQMLDDLLRWLQQAHLAVRPTKCLFGSKFVEFLDHLVGGNCIAMYEENLKKIRQTKRS